MFTFKFIGQIIEWRGPAPFFFIPVPERICPDIKEAAKILSYGWGVVPVTLVIGGTEFTTSLFPRQGGYLVPIKDAVRLTEHLELGDSTHVSMTLGK